MRKRFWVSMIICLFATLSLPTFVALSEQQCKGPSVCAEARVFGGTKLRAKARASSPKSVKGTYGYSVKAGSAKKSDGGSYKKGYNNSWEVEKYTSTASAYAQNRGRGSDGVGYFATASESSGG